jgi:hypothetical protein
MPRKGRSDAVQEEDFSVNGRSDRTCREVGDRSPQREE